MSDHTITYDLRHPGNGTLRCHAAPYAACRAVFDCECERFYGYHVVDGVPHHYDTYEDGYTVRAHHVGRFDPDECALIPWHENSDEDVSGTVCVTVDPDWHEDCVEFHAVSAEVYKP